MFTKKQPEKKNFHNEIRKFTDYAEAAQYIAELANDTHHIKLTCEFPGKTIKFSRLSSPEENELIDNYECKSGKIPLGLKILLFSAASRQNPSVEWIGTELKGYQNRLVYLGTENQNRNVNMDDELSKFKEQLASENIVGCSLEKKCVF